MARPKRRGEDEGLGGGGADELRLAVMGGSFDPFHKGHRKLLKRAAKALPGARVSLMPSGESYHKAGRRTPGIYRYYLAQLGLKDKDSFAIDSCELARRGPSYTWDSYQDFCRRYPQLKQWQLICGSDVPGKIELWHRAPELLQAIGLAVLTRPETERGTLVQRLEELEARYGTAWTLVEGKEVPLSSTAIRRGIQAEFASRRRMYAQLLEQRKDRRSQKQEGAEGPAEPTLVLQHLEEAEAQLADRQALENWRSALRPAQVDFILQHELYVVDVLYEALDEASWQLMRDLEALLFQYLSPARILHSWGVATTALILALRFGEDPCLAALAGLGHDIAKELDKQQVSTLLAPYGEGLGLKRQALVHGPAGAALLARELGLDHPDLASAVYWHTTLHAGSRPLEQIVFLADKIEPGRSYQDLAPIRALAEQDLEAATYLCLAATTSQVRRQKLEADPDSLRALEELGVKLEQRRSPWAQKALSEARNLE